MTILMQPLKDRCCVRSWLLSCLTIIVFAWSGAPVARAIDTTWTYDGDGNWSTGINWDNGEPVDATYNAFIDDGDTAVTVTLDVNRTVGDLTLGSDDQLSIPNSKNLILAGDLSGSGTLSIHSAGSATDLAIETAVTFTGGGKVILSGNNSARILDESGDPNGHLINVDYTIHGRGQIGIGRMQLTNQTGGIIDADQAGLNLVINPNANGVTNSGMMQASTGGILYLENGTFTNTGGTIQATEGSSVQLEAASIIGGTLTTVGSGIIQTATTSINQLQDLTNSGLIWITNSDNIQLVGSIENQATIRAHSTGSHTDLLIESVVSLTGGGEVLMSGDLDARILDESGDPDGHLINVDNTIHGRGQIGFNRMQITNQALGTIDADVLGSQLIINPNVAGVTNAGTMQASAGGILYLENGTFTNTGGTIQATEGSFVQLEAASIVGGTLTTVGSGIIETANLSINQLQDLTNSGLVRINNADNLQLIGSIENQATIQVHSAGSLSDLIIETEVVLTGGGEVLMSGDLDARILDESGDPDGHLINIDNTIHGEGQIGGNRIGMTNRGLVEADVVGETLRLDLRDADLNPNNGPDGLVNAGTLRARGGGQMILYESRIENYEGMVDGIIEAVEVSSRVHLKAAHVIGGVLQTDADGIIDTYDVGINVLEDLTINGLVWINNADNLQLVGTINNNNTINIASTGSFTDLLIETEVTLTGGGSIVLSGNTDARITDESDDPDGHLMNANNLIHGQGQIGYDRMRITNQADGTIDADVATKTLTIDPNAAGAANSGMMQASSEGILRLYPGVYTNSGGTIQALDKSSVKLFAATITGGTLTTEGTGVIDTGDARVNVLEDVIIDGFVRINNADNLELIGTIENRSNTIEIHSAGSSTDLLIETEVTLTGGGEIVLTGDIDANIQDRGGDPLGHLINVDNTIHGQGRIGFGRTQITNQANGTIDADVAGALLVVQPNVAGVANMGTMQATGGGILRLYTGTVTNAGGTIHAGDGSTVQLDGVTIRNGIVRSAGSGIIQTSSANLNVFEDLTVDGLVRIHNTDNLQLVGNIINTGTINIASTGSPTDLVIESEVTLTGGGEILLSGNPDARILDDNGPVEGRLINTDNTIRGWGQLGDGRLVEVVNNGAIAGDSATKPLYISVPLSGTGSLENVIVSSSHSPGASPAVIDMSGLYRLTTTARLNIELGGTTPGTEHDQLDSDGTVQLGGTLTAMRIDLGGGLFEPAVGDRFVIIQADQGVSGTFLQTHLEDTPRPIGAYEILYEPTEVVLRYGEGDVDSDGDVDGNDFLVWQRNYEILGGATYEEGDFNLDGNVDEHDLWVWQHTFGGILGVEAVYSAAVPEPVASLISLILVGGLLVRRLHREHYG